MFISVWQFVMFLLLVLFVYLLFCLFDINIKNKQFKALLEASHLSKTAKNIILWLSTRSIIMIRHIWAP